MPVPARFHPDAGGAQPLLRAGNRPVPGLPMRQRDVPVLVRQRQHVPVHVRRRLPGRQLRTGFESFLF